MRRALGRLLGIVLTLTLTSAVALAAVAALASALARDRGRPALPLYFNPAPSNVHDRAQAAIQQLARGSDTTSAERELVRLGGAALPHVLPRLETLRPSVRGQVAVALVPLAKRMGASTSTELGTAEAALAFWAGFWQDRAFDFRPQIVRRLVSRLAERASPLGRDDIVHLDTYALPELIASLGRIRTAEDVARASRVTAVLAHITARGDVVEPSMSPADARVVVRNWRRFFSDYGADFMTLDGPGRLTAMFAQTVYGRWLGRVFGFVRVGQERQAAFGIRPGAALRSGVGYLTALASAIVLAALWLRFESRATAVARSASRALASAILLLPVPLLASVVHGRVTAPAWLGWTLCVLLTAASGAAVASRLGLSGLNPSLPRRSELTRKVALGAVLRSAPSMLAWTGTSFFAVELLFDLDGAATAAVRGLTRRDVTPAMSLALGGTLVAAALASLSDVASTWTRPIPREPALIEVGGGKRRTYAAAAALAVVLLAVLTALSSSPEGTLGWADLARGARNLLGYGMITLGVATLSGLVLGALAASGPRILDGVLVRTAELSGALPAVVWCAALAQVLGTGMALAIGLGVCRGVDVAWCWRAEQLRRAHADSELGVRSLGHYPLKAHWRERLRPAALPAVCALALTPAWWVALGAASWWLGVPALPGPRGWEALLSGAPTAPVVPALVAALLLAFLTWLLLSVGIAAPRRVGAFRSSIPPPPN